MRSRAGFAVSCVWMETGLWENFSSKGLIVKNGFTWLNTKFYG